MENTDSRDSQDMLSLRHVRVRYGEVEILHGITFDVKRGETLVILGGSGSGKSTLLRALVGLEKPSSGEIWIKARTSRRSPNRKWRRFARRLACRSREELCSAR